MIKRIQSLLADLETNTFLQYLLLAGITLLAAVLRFYKLGEWSFWGDEMFTLRDSENPFQNGLSNLPTISFVLIYSTRTLFGTSEWTARLMPALVGVMSVPILYFPIRRMLNVSTALIACLLLAISPWHIYWSQNARFYVLLLLFYSLALLSFFFWLEEDRFRYLFSSLFFLALAANERLTAFFFIPVAACYLGFLMVLPFAKPAGLRLRNLAILIIPGVILTFYIGTPILRDPIEWLQTFNTGWVNNSPAWILAGVIYYVGVSTVCISGLGALYLLSKQSRPALLLVLGAGVPLVALMILSLITYTANRYVFISLTSWIILTSAAAYELIRQTKGNAKLLGAGVLAILVFTSLGENALYYRYQNGNRDDWKAAFAYVEQHKRADDQISVSNTLLGEYYLNERPIGLGNLDFSRIEQSDVRTWFVADMNVEEKWPHANKWLQENARLMTYFDVHVQARNFKMRVYLFDPEQKSTLERASQ